MTNTQTEVLALLNDYDGDNIWQDVIYELVTADEWARIPEDGLDSMGHDSFAHDGVTYTFTVRDKWVAS